MADLLKEGLGPALLRGAGGILATEDELQVEEEVGEGAW